MRLFRQKRRTSVIVLQRLLLCFLFFSSYPLYAQTGMLSGVVKDSIGGPIPGATITVKSSNLSAISKNDGSFLLAAGSGDVLTVSAVGYQEKLVSLGNDDNITVSMSPLYNTLNDVVVVGYGTQRKKDLTGSIATVDVSEAKKMSTSDINGLLQGRAAGVQVNSDGQPGASPSVRIRGFSTLGSSSPFYVIDGVPIGTSIRDFSPNDVESISVLKDAAAASIYGAAAANGVIIITTKHGNKNAPVRVEYNGYYGWDKVWQTKDVTNREQYQLLNNESRVNAGLTPFPANDPANSGFVGNIDTDWQAAGLKTGNRQNHFIGVSGGGSNSTFNLSLDYFDNKGTYVGNGPDYKRYTAHINSTAEKGIFKIGESFNYTHSRENTLTFRDDILLGGIPPMIVSLVSAIPTMPVYDSANLNGFGGSSSEFNGANSLNAIGVNSVFTNWVEVDRTFGNVYGEVQLLKNSIHNLRFRTSVSYDKTITRDYNWQPEFYFGKFFSSNVARLYDNSRIITNSAIENTLNYDLSAGKHSLQVLAGQSYRQNDFVVRTAYGEGFTQPYYPVVSAGQTNAATGTQSTWALSSYFGRLNYSYADRYLLSATLRRDGSSRFAPQNRFGYFPAASVGWKISSESFWNVPRSAISQLKLRGSYGKLGNDLNLGAYNYQGTINPNVVSLFYQNGTPIRVVGGLQTIIASPNVKWEAKAITNVGFDGSFLNDHLDFSAEYYYTKSTDVLVGVYIPLTTGYVNNNPIVNAASFSNKGFEFNATFHKTGGKFTFDVNANLSTVKNKVLALGTGNDYLSGAGARTAIGRELGEHFGYVYEGIFQSQAEVDAHAPSLADCRCKPAMWLIKTSAVRTANPMAK